MRRGVLLLVIGVVIVLLAFELPARRPAPEPGPEPGAAPPADPAALPDLAADAIKADPAATASETPDDALVLLVTGPDGEPVPRAWARIWKFPGRHGIRDRVEVLDGRGVHVLAPPLPDSIRVEVYGAEGCGPTITGPLSPEPQTVRIRLPEPVAISGRVLDQHGEPVPGVRVEARTAYTEFRRPMVAIDPPHGSAFSGEDGTFRIDGLGRRAYRLLMGKKEGYEPLGRWETVPGGAITDPLLCWRLSTLALRVVGPDGRPVVGANVCVRDRRMGHSRQTDAEGWARFEDFNSRLVYQIEVRPPGDREDVLMWKRRGGVPDDPVIELAPALPLAGTVRDTDGEPVAEGQISWRPAGSADRWHWVHTDSDGRFRITRVPVGRIEVRAMIPDYEAEPEPDMVKIVAAGREDLEFVVRKTPTVAIRFADWAEGETGTGNLHVEGRKRYGSWGRPIGTSGVLRFSGLRPDDVVSVLVRTSLDRVWVGRGLRPDGKLRVVRGLVPSSITGELLGMRKGARLRVEARVLWGLDIVGRIEPDGRFEIPGVPPGRWSITVDPTHAGVNLWGRAEAVAGEHVEIELVDRQPGRSAD